MPIGNEAPLHGLQNTLFTGWRECTCFLKAPLMLQDMWMVTREQNRPVTRKNGLVLCRYLHGVLAYMLAWGLIL